MDIIRKGTVAVKSAHEFQIGDQIRCGKYTATCEKITGEKVIFCLDQYLDKRYRMNATTTNEGGYEKSALRQELLKDFSTDPNFDGIRQHLVAFENGDPVRIPTVGELFGPDDFYEADGYEQWELMKDWRNRVALRESEEYEWGWLQNRVKDSETDFARVRQHGMPVSGSPTPPAGVRPVIMLAL